MGTAELIEKWRCDYCREVYDDEDDAKECCPNEVMVYVCSVCGTTSDFYNQAKNACDCKPPDPDAPPPPPTTAELEAAGQTRLF